MHKQPTLMSIGEVGEKWSHQLTSRAKTTNPPKPVGLPKTRISRYSLYTMIANPNYPNYQSLVAAFRRNIFIQRSSRRRIACPSDGARTSRCCWSQIQSHGASFCRGDTLDCTRTIITFYGSGICCCRGHISYTSAVTGSLNTIIVGNVFSDCGFEAVHQQYSFTNTAANCVILVRRQRHCGQNTDNRNDDHQFNQRKTLLDFFHHFN